MVPQILSACALACSQLTVLLKEKVVGEDLINIREGELVRLRNILEFFNQGGRISSVGPQSLF